MSYLATPTGGIIGQPTQKEDFNKKKAAYAHNINGSKSVTETVIVLKIVARILSKTGKYL